MGWTYDATNLDTSTASGRLNSVRLLIFDTDTNNQLLQDEEINFALSENNNRVYYAASYSAALLASKFSREVDTQLDETLEAKYSQLSEQYRNLSTSLREMGKKVSGSALGIAAGGINKTTIDSVRDNANRPPAAFKQNQFRNPPSWPTDLSYD